MTFEESLKAMRNGDTVTRSASKNLPLYFKIKHDILRSGRKTDLHNLSVALGISSEDVMANDWEIVGEPSVHTPTDLKITFIGGNVIVIPDEQWDDYHYDGKFFTIVKDGADIAMYNARQVFSLVLVREGAE